MTGDKTLRCYTVPLLLILCYFFQNSNLFDPLQGFRLSSRMEDVPESDPSERPVSGSLSARRWNVVRHSSCSFSREITSCSSYPHLYCHALLSVVGRLRRPETATDGGPFNFSNAILIFISYA
jgi:hypothetical protein